MSRVLIFIAWIIFFAGAITLAVGNDGVVGVELLGWRADIPAGAAIIASLALLALFALLISSAKDLALAPKSARARREIARRETGVAALTRGLEAIAAGDGKAARREAKAAEKALPGSPAAKLIAAQAAQLVGDDAAAGEALAGMLDAPETEFLALRGLYARAMRAGDFDTARRHAERAFDRRDSARWAFEAAFDLALARLDYRAATDLIARGARSKAIERAVADRGLAAVMTARAYAADAAGDRQAAASDADAALRLAPGLAPAAILAARLAAAQGDRRRAAKTLGQAFRIAPERALAETLEEISAAATAEERAAAFEKLASTNEAAREATLLKAKAALARQDGSAAATMLAGLLRASADRRALLAMAEARALLSGESAAREFLLRAASASASGGPGAAAFSRLTGEGWRRLIRDYMNDARLAPPSLDAPAPGLDESALAPPAPALEPGPVPEAESLAEPPAAIAPPDARVDHAPIDRAIEVAAAPADDTDTDEALDRDVAAARGVN